MRHVLIIEDMFLFQQYLKDIVTLAGASSIALASTQQEAIESARSRKPFLILSDINLSQGSGVSAIGAILADHGTIPVIYITGHPQLCVSKHDVLLTKPVTADLLLKTVGGFFDGSAQQLRALSDEDALTPAEIYAASSASSPYAVCSTRTASSV